MSIPTETESTLGKDMADMGALLDREPTGANIIKLAADLIPSPAITDPPLPAPPRSVPPLRPAAIPDKARDWLIDAIDIFVMNAAAALDGLEGAAEYDEFRAIVIRLQQIRNRTLEQE